MSKFPETLYAQKGVYQVVNSQPVEEIVVNQTPQGALRRELGKGLPPGTRVGVYKLERIVQLAIGIQEVATQAPAEVATTAAPASQ